MKLKIVPTVYVAVGLPASGKSFWWETAITQKLLPKKNCKRLEIELIRNDLTGDFEDHSKDELVQKVALSNLKIFLVHNTPIIYVDDLNLDKNKRCEIVKVCKEFNYKAVAMYFATDVSICENRLKKSKKKIPLEILQRFDTILKENPVDYDEGWDDIIVIK